jgi:hypothetical protein
MPILRPPHSHPPYRPLVRHARWWFASTRRDPGIRAGGALRIEYCRSLDVNGPFPGCRCSRTGAYAGIWARGQFWGQCLTGQAQFHGTHRAASPCHFGQPPIQRLAIAYNPLTSPDTRHFMTWDNYTYLYSFTPPTSSHQYTCTQA